MTRMPRKAERTSLEIDESQGPTWCDGYLLNGKGDTVSAANQRGAFLSGVGFTSPKSVLYPPVRAPFPLPHTLRGILLDSKPRR